VIRDLIVDEFWIRMERISIIEPWNRIFHADYSPFTFRWMKTTINPERAEARASELPKIPM